MLIPVRLTVPVVPSLAQNAEHKARQLVRDLGERLPPTSTETAERQCNDDAADIQSFQHQSWARLVQLVPHRWAAAAAADSTQTDL
jgi:hypothetical protein